jgi:hypothetical protein
MADITMSSPAQVSAPSQNTVGIQFVARGTVTAPKAAQSGQAPGKVGTSPLTCVIKLQSNGIEVTRGEPYTSGTNWLARFGPLFGLASPPYQVVANAPSTTYDPSVTASQMYFDPTIQIAITNNPANPWPRSFTVSGTYSSDPTYTVTCALLDSSGNVLATGIVTTPQPGQWQARFNLTSGQPICWLLVEIYRTSTPSEAIAATWIDGINIP